MPWPRPEAAPGFSHCLLVGSAEEFQALEHAGIGLPQATRFFKPTGALGLLQAALLGEVVAPASELREQRIARFQARSVVRA